MRTDSIFYRLAYRSGRPRWDSAQPRPELIELTQGRPSGRALDLGCGTGTDCIYLAGQGWEALGVDFAPKAIAIARARAAASGSSASFTVGDVTRLREVGVRGQYDLVIDIGCYHAMKGPARPGEATFRSSTSSNCAPKRPRRSSALAPRAPSRRQVAGGSATPAR